MTACCVSDNPEPGRMGRCAWGAATSMNRCTFDGFNKKCPVACGLCAICQGHTQYHAYTQMAWRRAKESLGVAATMQIETGKAAPVLNSSEPSLGVALPLFGSTTSADVVAITSGCVAGQDNKCWRAWRPSDPPWPPQHPFGDQCREGHLTFGMAAKQCYHWHRNRHKGTTKGCHLQSYVDERGLNQTGCGGNKYCRLQYVAGRVNQSMCLAHRDYVSDYIVHHGRWRDCGSHVRLWQRLDGLDIKELKQLKQLRAAEIGDPEGILIEVGANIGACTVELLLRTRAKILAFEPSPVNNFYLTRSLRALAQAHPEVAHRVVVFPVGLGEARIHQPMFVPIQNLGNSMMLSASQRGQPDAATVLQQGAVPIDVHVFPLSTLFPQGLGGVRALKLDVQGFECNVLRGAWPLFAPGRSPSLQLIATEVASKHLHLHLHLHSHSHSHSHLHLHRSPPNTYTGSAAPHTSYSLCCAPWGCRQLSH